MTGAELRAWREKEDLSIDDLSVLCGLNRRVLSEIEAGQRPVPPEVLSHVVDGVAEPLPQVMPVSEKRSKATPLVFDPVAEGLVRGPVSNAEFGASKLWDDRVLDPTWQRVEGGIRVVNSAIPRPLNCVVHREKRFWAGEDGVITADGRVYHAVTGAFMGDFYREFTRPAGGLRPGSLAQSDKKYRR